MKTALVVTTIHDCTALLDGYRQNFAKYGREATVYVIPDVKTPAFSPKGVMVVELGAQDAFLRQVGYPPDEIPRNSDNRRNVGYLMAMANGADLVISIDDDNWCSEDEDFIGEHARVLGDSVEQNAVGTSSGWYNNCELACLASVYPRGFPYFARDSRPVFIEWARTRVAINAGMWTGDPDLDAMTWLGRPTAFGLRTGEEAVLAADTWCPINSQNTAVARDLMPAYWFVRMDPPNDRFGDIFQGYFALKVAKAMGWTARFGSPFVHHKRNEHVYLKDVAKEIGPILALEELLPQLIEVKLQETTVNDAYLSLIQFIDGLDTLPRTADVQEFYRTMAKRMRLWAGVCGRIG